MTRPQYFAMCAIAAVALLAYFRTEQLTNIITGRGAGLKKRQTVNV